MPPPEPTAGPSSTVTVTVRHDRDPSPRPHPELAALLGEWGAGKDLRATRDAIYAFRLPAEIPIAEIERFATSFLGVSPECVASVARGLEVPPRARDEASLIVLRRPGVMDPVEGSIHHALADAGLPAARIRVRVAARYRFAARGLSLGRDSLELLAAGRLANAIVDEWSAALPGEPDRLPDPFRTFPAHAGGRVEVPLVGRDDGALLALSEAGGLSLDLDEMRAIERHFAALGREPTETELETIAQTWSEHCCHKTLTGPIDYDGERIGNLLAETIFAATRTIAAPWCWSVFRDNAGVIGIDDEWGITFKVETHNHPSALEPYGGAGTGVGGVIRDTLGTGRGARPVLGTDVFCFAPLDLPTDQLPPGTLHPTRILAGVVAGVRDYGNRMGIPTASGAIVFHPGYVGNPLVFCGSVGVIRREHLEKEVRPEDRIVAIGGRTGRDGIHGATFSSRELTEESETLSSGAVQIGNPIEEKKVLDALLRARDEGLFRAVTDCGAGGFSSAVGEMGAETGATVELERAPLKYPGLTPTEIWISEAQERMVLAVPPEKMERLFALLAEEEVEGCDLGAFAADGVLRLTHEGRPIGELDCEFLHRGRPERVRRATRPARPARVVPDAALGPAELLPALLAHGSVASKERVIRQYDHEVQGRMVLRPLGGASLAAPMDGCALDPVGDGRHTAVVACGLAPLAGESDPWQMGAWSVDEALRNIIVSGGTLARTAILDNFAWGNVRDPAILGALVECARGASRVAVACGTPFISGKDSLHNTYRAGGVSRSIPGTLLVSALSVVPGRPRAPGSDLKRAGSAILHVGPPPSGIGGSLAESIAGGAGGELPPWREELARPALAAIERGISEGLILAAHDISDGGLAVAAAEMAFGGDALGLALDVGTLSAGRDPLVPLFGEGPHRFLIEVEPERVDEFIALAGPVPVERIGETVPGGRLEIRTGGRAAISAAVAELEATWRAPLAAVWPGGRA